MQDANWAAKRERCRDTVITMKRAEAVSFSMSLSSELSDSPLLSAATNATQLGERETSRLLLGQPSGEPTAMGLDVERTFLLLLLKLNRGFLSFLLLLVFLGLLLVLLLLLALLLALRRLVDPCERLTPGMVQT